MVETVMKGAGQCPRCASRSVRRMTMTDPRWVAFYAPEVEMCMNCKAVWEPLDAAEIWDKSDPFCSFRDPCQNCAFRPGSPEQSDPARWRELMNGLKAGASFNCHKGVPIDPASEHGFLYPHRNGQPVRDKLRSCRGWLNMLGPLWRKRGADA